MGVAEETVGVSPRVAAEVYPLAVKQACAQVIIQVVVLLTLIGSGFVVGFPLSFAFAAGLIGAGLVATVIDIRWWLWLRRADPVDAYRLLQLREDSSGRAS